MGMPVIVWMNIGSKTKMVLCYVYQRKYYEKNNLTLNLVFIFLSFYFLSHFLSNVSKIKYSLRRCLFFDWIEKTKIFDFFYLLKNDLLISTNITKVNLLSISSI